MKKILFVVLMALFVSGCAHQVYQPSPSDSCDQFAKIALRQNDEYLRKNCRFKDTEGWHGSYDRYYEWCKRVSPAEADNRIRRRDDALADCDVPDRPRGDRIRNWCNHYAQTAVSQYDENKRLGCGFRGKEWHGKYQSHYNWCRQVRQSEAEAATNSRAKAIEKCSLRRKPVKGGCDRYARTAVRQNDRNRKNRCGYKGKGWHSNYDAHFQWCRKVSKADADAVTEDREKKLRQCPAGAKANKRCEQYAKKSIQQNKDNLQWSCSIVGRRWHSSYDSHYRWCTKVPPRKAESELRAREERLKQCGSKKGCDQYAEEAVRQNETNREKECNYKGPNWHSDFDAHYKWCMKEIPGRIDSARQDREKALKECRAPRDKCEWFAREMVRLNKKNLRKGCGYSGLGWHSDHDAHVRWCLKASEDSAASLLNKNANLLRRCR